MKLANIKEKLGPLWWYTLLIFCVQRFSDVLNLVAGLWLVPKYVPQSELGAVQPLMQIGLMLGLPVSVLVTPFMKILNTHVACKEYGKVKALLRDALILSGIVFVVMLLVARLLMPSVFRYIRVENGLLALLILTSSIVGAIVPVFNGILQALKRFSVYSAISLMGSPVRFISLLVALPIRGLSGYFASQITVPLLTISVTLIDFLRKFGKDVKCESYWKEDRALFVKILIPIAILGVFGNIKGTAEVLLLRRIPDVESAAYYCLSRFSDIASYIAGPLVFVLFPTISERHELGEQTRKMLIQSMGFILVSGLVLATGLMIGGESLLGLVSLWKPYQPYSHLFFMMTMIASMRMAVMCFTTHEIACRRFRYAYYLVPLYLIEVAIIQFVFNRPGADGVMSVWSLSDVLGLMLVFSVAPLIAMFIDLGVAIRTPRHANAQ